MIADFPCQLNAELCRREGHYIRNTQCVNHYIPGRTRQEYRYDNKAKINARKKAKFLCDCGGKYTRTNRARHILSLQHQSFISKQE